ncbi:Uncharacterised protein [Mycobacterium tuberculosis]|nr:Uncharacterised protein [Mycobacterium tuberculosis]
MSAAVISLPANHSLLPSSLSQNAMCCLSCGLTSVVSILPNTGISSGRIKAGARFGASVNSSF